MKSLIVIMLCSISAASFAQRLSNFVSAGMGTSMEDNIEGCTNQNRMRYIGSMSLYYRITDRISIGAEAIGSNRLSIFGNSSCDVTDPSDNSLKLGPSNMRAGTVLMHTRMKLLNYKEMEPYIDMGVGINTYYYSIPLNDAGTVQKRSFVYSPEVGISMYKFQFACKLIMGAKTPSYSAIDSESNRMVSLKSVRAQQVYLTIGYQLFKL
ncbi:MAG: hypothetical protein WCF67_17340 [Chitinophagaceae bacterium]